MTQQLAIHSSQPFLLPPSRRAVCVRACVRVCGPMPAEQMQHGADGRQRDPADDTAESQKKTATQSSSQQRGY